MSDFVKVKDLQGRYHAVNKEAVASVAWIERKDHFNKLVGAFEVYFTSGGIQFFAENPVDPFDVRRPQPLVAEVA